MPAGFNPRGPALTLACLQFDYAEGTKRAGDRAVAVGEKPFFDPKSVSRREALAIEAEQAPSVL